jgi:hypothetical protein
MPYSNEVKIEALKLFLKGIPIEVISRENFNGKPSKVTLWKWYRVYNWEGKRLEAKQKADKELNGELTDFMVKQKRELISIHEKVVNLVHKKLDEEKDVSFNDLLNLYKYEGLLLGQATERTEVKSDFIDDVRAAIERIKRKESKRSE